MAKQSRVSASVGVLGWLLASLVLAMMIWVAAQMDANPVEQDELKDIPVVVQLPDGYILAETPEHEHVTALLRMEADEWDLVVPSDVLITADLGDVSAPGQYRVPLKANLASTLHGSVVALRPNSVVYTLDREYEERMPIHVVISREPPLGYTYPPDMTCEQTEVLVSGNAEIVSEVARIEARLNLSNDRNPATRTVNLVAMRENGLAVRSSDVQLEPASVECFIDIRVREDVTPLEVLPDRGGSRPPGGYIFEGYQDIDPGTIGVTGDADAISAMNRVVNTIPIDLSDKTETFTTEVPLALPDGVTLVTEDQLIRVTVLISPVIGSREFAEVPVEIAGLDTTQYAASGLAPTVTVTVSGPQAQLDDLSVEDVRVVANLAGLEPGNHSLTPEGAVIGQSEEDAFEISSILPEQLTVTIEALSPTDAAPRNVPPTP